MEQLAIGAKSRVGQTRRHRNTSEALHASGKVAYNCLSFKLQPKEVKTIRFRILISVIEVIYLREVIAWLNAHHFYA